MSAPSCLALFQTFCQVPNARRALRQQTKSRRERGIYPQFLHVAYHAFVGGTCDHDKANIGVLVKGGLHVARQHRAVKPVFFKKGRAHVHGRERAKLYRIENGLVTVARNEYFVARIGHRSYARKDAASAAVNQKREYFTPYNAAALSLAVFNTPLAS